MNAQGMKRRGVLFLDYATVFPEDVGNGDLTVDAVPVDDVVVVRRVEGQEDETALITVAKRTSEVLGDEGIGSIDLLDRRAYRRPSRIDRITGSTLITFGDPVTNEIDRSRT